MLPRELDKWLEDWSGRPLVMGVLNITPDSFSDGGRFDSPQAAADAALEMFAAGADLLDVGGESTRPGAHPIAAEEQLRRILPAIKLIRRSSEAVLSVDTQSWAVASAAAGEGANLINDISAGRDDPAMLPGAGAAGLPVVLMHMQGTPQNMQAAPAYSDVTAEVAGFLRDRIAAAQAAGIENRRILLDPGIGFGKSADHSLQLLRDTAALTSLGRPLVIGTSRKSFIGKILGETDPKRRVFGDAAAISWAVANGAAMVRVHDVGPMGHVLKMIRAIQGC